MKCGANGKTAKVNVCGPIFANFSPKPQPEVEDDASATDLHKEKKVRVRVSQLGLRFIPVQPEPDAGEDEAHPKESHRHTDQQGWQAAEEGRTGI
jgi:hypothetical protein